MLKKLATTTNTNTKHLVETFKKLVTIDSPTGSEKAVSDYLKTCFSALTISVKQDKKLNIFATVPGRGEPMLFAAHMDTVEPGRGIVPKIKGDHISSNGSTILGADNKSTIAVILEMLTFLKKSKTPHRPLEILITVDEESGNTGASSFDYSQISAKKGIVADIAEPLGTIVLASPAYMRFNAAFTGKSGHAAYPERAVSVLPALAEVLRIPTGHLDDQTTLNMGIITAGDTRNTVPGSALVQGEIRSYDENLLRKHTEKLVGSINSAASKNGVRVKIETKLDNPGYFFDKNDHYIQAIASVFTKLTIKPRFIKSPSVSDANIFNSRGLQMINVGDGTKNTHSVAETISIHDMEKLLSFFIEMVQ